MTKNGHLRTIANLTGLMNSQALALQDLRISDPARPALDAEYTRLNHRRQDLVGAALTAGVDRERIQAITYREAPLRLR